MCIGDASGVPADTWSVAGVARPVPTGADAERFRGAVDNADRVIEGRAGRHVGALDGHVIEHADHPVGFTP